MSRNKKWGDLIQVENEIHAKVGEYLFIPWEGNITVMKPSTIQEQSNKAYPERSEKYEQLKQRRRTTFRIFTDTAVKRAIGSHSSTTGEIMNNVFGPGGSTNAKEYRKVYNTLDTLEKDKEIESVLLTKGTILNGEQIKRDLRQWKVIN